MDNDWARYFSMDIPFYKKKVSFRPKKKGKCKKNSWNSSGFLIGTNDELLWCTLIIVSTILISLVQDISKVQRKKGRTSPILKKGIQKNDRLVCLKKVKNFIVIVFQICLKDKRNVVFKMCKYFDNFVVDAPKASSTPKTVKLQLSPLSTINYTWIHTEKTIEWFYQITVTPQNSKHHPIIIL